MHRLLCTAALATIVGCTGASGQARVDASSDVALTISNPDGPVTITGVSDSAAVIVSWTVHAGEDPADPDDADVSVSGEGSAVGISVTKASDDIWVDLDISAPSGASFQVDSGAGDVVLDGVTGGGTVSTDEGLVDGAGLAGSLEVSVGLSEVHLATTIEGGDVITVSAVSGPIVLQVPETTDALLTASTDDGEVLIDGVPFSGTNVGGSAAGELGAGATATVTLSTGAGNVEIVASGR